jgi:16S rRNA (guanine527-N7)-methyltransferase
VQNQRADPGKRLTEGGEFVLGRPLRNWERERFTQYLELLTAWQRVHRLVGSSDPLWLVENVVLDSLLFLRILRHGASPLLDLGAGAGIPGIPIKIASDATEMTLVESRARRASFLTTVVRELRLSRVEVVNARAESILDREHGRFSAAVLRCAGAVDRMIPLALEFVRPGGVVIAAGSPVQAPIDGAERLTVPGTSAGTTRSFVVARRA